MIFCVSYADYDCYSPIYVAGPDVPNWEAYCQQFLDEAAERAVVKVKGEKYGNIGYPEIAEALVDILCEHGYTRMRLNEFQLCGPGVIQEKQDQERCGHQISDEALKAIILRNIEVDKRLNKELFEGRDYVPEWWSQYEQPKESPDSRGTSQPTEGIPNS